MMSMKFSGESMRLANLTDYILANHIGKMPWRNKTSGTTEPAKRSRAGKNAPVGLLVAKMPIACELVDVYV